MPYLDGQNLPEVAGGGLRDYCRALDHTKRRKNLLVLMRALLGEAERRPCAHGPVAAFRASGVRRCPLARHGTSQRRAVDGGRRETRLPRVAHPAVRSTVDFCSKQTRAIPFPRQEETDRRVRHRHRAVRCTQNIACETKMVHVLSVSSGRRPASPLLNPPQSLAIQPRSVVRSHRTSCCRTISISRSWNPCNEASTLPGRPPDQ